MKRFLLLSLVALFGASLVRAETTRADVVDRVETCEAILASFQRGQHAIPKEVIRKAQAIIITNQFKGAFLLGIKDGYGVIMVRKPTGGWSLPVLVSAGEASVGLQVGANSVETVYIINDPKVPRLLFNHRFNIGVDAKAVAGPKAAESEKLNKEILDAPVLVYTKSTGLYAGVTVKGGHLSRSDSANFMLYNTRYTLPELLYSDWVQAEKSAPEVLPLMKMMRDLAP